MDCKQLATRNLESSTTPGVCIDNYFQAPGNRALTRGSRLDFRHLAAWRHVAKNVRTDLNFLRSQEKSPALVAGIFVAYACKHAPWQMATSHATRCLVVIALTAGLPARAGVNTTGEPNPGGTGPAANSWQRVRIVNRQDDWALTAGTVTPEAPVPADFQRDLRKTGEVPRNRRANRPSCSRSTCHPDRNETR